MAEFLFLPAAGDCPRLGCFVIFRGCCLQLKEIAVLIYLLGVQEGSPAASPGLSTLIIPRLSFVHKLPCSAPAGASGDVGLRAQGTRQVAAREGTTKS